jgi:hypothetical protein
VRDSVKGKSYLSLNIKMYMYCSKASLRITGMCGRFLAGNP